ncbi:MAG: hypothetical protein K0M60_17825 [Hydrogenophaga sp.]|nr:hypothetical protein [Hydrogenophaga sp.]
MFDNATLNAAFGSIASRWKRYQDGAQTRHELSRLRAEEIDAIAASCELSAKHFIEVMSRGPDAANELAAVMRALGMEFPPSQFGEQSMLNRMKVACADCREKSTCRGSIRNGAIAQGYEAFCKNADAINLLKIRSLRSSLECRK